MRKETLKDIPLEDVGEQVQGYVDSGFIRISVSRQGDGLWTIVAEKDS